MKEEKIIEACKKEKASAQKKLYLAYSPALRGVCNRYIKDRDETEDVLQDSFVRIFFNIKTFTLQGEGSLFAWMKRIVINAAINHLKKYREKLFEESFNDKNEMEIADKGDDFFENSFARYSKQEVINAFLKIPEEFGIVLNMAILDGIKHKDIAESLGIAEQTSRSRLTRGKRLFREILLQSENSVNLQIKKMAHK